MSEHLTRPGETGGWPKLKISYLTDPEKIADLLPPGLDPIGDPVVQINVYCVPILGEPEYGVSTKVRASFDGMEGLYCVGMGIDQEAAIFISQELNGQPKFPCNISFYRIENYVEAVCEHQGYTFMEFKGQSTGLEETLDGDIEENEWWIKSSRKIGSIEKEYDFPPHVVRVHSVSEPVEIENLNGELVLRDSPWALTQRCFRFGNKYQPNWFGPLIRAVRYLMPDRWIQMHSGHMRILSVVPDGQVNAAALETGDLSPRDSPTIQ